MLRSADTLPQGAVLTADICIIGAGPAGITLARALSATGKRILLVEAGGPKGEDGAQRLYQGTTANTAFHQPPDSDRARGIGGTSAMWGGRCMPYDPQDFIPRDHIPNSGWPFALDALLPYYHAAQQEADCGPYAYTAAVSGLDGTMISDAGTEDLRLDTLERWSPPRHFGKAHRVDLHRSGTITVLTGAVATNLMHVAGRITEVHLRSVKRRMQLVVRAGTTVLAGGGLEVPRLLMHTATATAPALGDHSGWLGRGYMCHVGGVVARLRLTAGRQVIFGYEQDPQGVFVRRRLTLSADAQTRHRLPNFYALLDRPLLDDADHQSAVLSFVYLAKRLFQRQTVDQSQSEGRFAHYRRHLRNLLVGAPEVLTVLPKFGRQRFLTGRRLPSLLLKSNDNSFYLYFHAEQSANPDSRLTLTSDRDAVGMRKLHVDARLSDEDAEGILRAHQVIGAELARTGAGQLEFLKTDDPMSAIRACKCTLGHHIGGTRMAALPQDGVVDQNGRVHGTENLYVASAAMLPTSSQAHPTLTVLALSLRLAEHLRNS